MGTPVPPPITPDPVPAGDTCIRCWGAGKEFGDIATPSKITISISGVVKGPNWFPALGEPPDGVFELTQLGFSPCGYGLTAGGIAYTAGFNQFGTEVTITDLIFGTVYFSMSENICELLTFSFDLGFFDGGTILIILPGVE